MKNAVVIGASSGIGKSLFDELSSCGFQVFGSYKGNKSFTENDNYFYLDVLQEEIDFSFLPENIDALIYCPGQINLKPFHRISPETFIDDYRVQFLGAVRVIQALLPRLKKSANASIVLFSTIAVQKGFSFHSLVSSSKGAIEGLTKSLASELSPSIRVNCIAPSLTDTPLAERLLNSPEKRENQKMRHPLNQIGEPGDISSMASFLISDKAKWITGQILHVDGGLSTLNN